MVVTRGGAGVWYRDLTNRSVEIFDLIGADAFRDHAATWKQHQISPFDRQLLAGAIAAAGVRRARLLHPQVMYRLLTAYWKEEAVLEPIGAFLRYGPLPPPPPHPVTEYAPCRVRRGEVLFQPVVSRHRRQPRVCAAHDRRGGGTDARGDVERRRTARRSSRRPDRVGRPRPDDRAPTFATTLPHRAPSSRGARGFIGTYGGFSYLAPLYGVDSLSFFSDARQARAVSPRTRAARVRQPAAADGSSPSTPQMPAACR